MHVRARAHTHDDTLSPLSVVLWLTFPGVALLCMSFSHLFSPRPRAARIWWAERKEAERERNQPDSWSEAAGAQSDTGRQRRKRAVREFGATSWIFIFNPSRRLHLNIKPGAARVGEGFPPRDRMVQQWHSSSLCLFKIFKTGTDSLISQSLFFPQKRYNFSFSFSLGEQFSTIHFCCLHFFFLFSWHEKEKKTMK